MNRLRHICILVLLVSIAGISQAEGQYNDIVLKMPRFKGKVYELLDIVAKKIDKSFIYDSNVIDNNKKGKIKGGEYTIQQIVCDITGDDKLELKEFGNHILIARKYNNNSIIQDKDQNKGNIVIKGCVIDKFTRKPIVSSSVYLVGKSIASVTNSNGEFRLTIPDSLKNIDICFSHIGYISKSVELNLLENKNCMIELQEHVTSLQEIVVKLNNPIMLLDKMCSGIRKNYSSSPVYFTSFYREGIESNRKFIKLNEGVFKIYKSSVITREKDYVSLLKKRTITKSYIKDSVNARIKAGIEACMELDIVKNMPEFIIPTNLSYKYFSIGETTIDDRTANIVYFEQKNNIEEPLFCGELYIDADNYALLGANIEVNPKYVKASGDMFIEKKSRNLVIAMEKVSYRIYYKQYDGLYYINYVRGDLLLNTKSRKRLFGSSHKRIWFEMATCKIDTAGVTKFEKEEVFSSQSIFDETKYQYDNSFWDNMNIIPIEESIENAISKISLKIEESKFISK